MDNKLGYNPHEKLIFNDLLYKSLSYTWALPDTTQEAISRIMSEDVGKYLNTPLALDILEKITPYMKKLIDSKHSIEKRYTKMVKEQRNKSSFNKNISVHLRQLIPADLVGGKRNRLHLIDRITKALKFGKEEVLTLRFFMSGLKLKSILWLKGQIQFSLRTNLLAKLVAWLWKISKSLVASNHYVTETQAARNRLVYIPKIEWKSCSDRAFNKLVDSDTLLRLTVSEAEEKAKLFPPCRLRWLPKERGLRPIIYIKGEKDERIVVAKLFISHILKRSYNYTNLGSKRIYEIWCDIVKHNHSHGRPPLFFVSVDLVDAYGSIVQETLINIVRNSTATCFGADFSSKTVEIEKVVKSNGTSGLIISESSQDKTKCKIIMKETLRISDILKNIEDIIKSQTISRLKHTYLLAKGISQALPISAALCNLYLAHIDQTFLSRFTQASGDTLIRVVDDYLYVTSNKLNAEEFLTTMNEGFSDYGMYTNKAKSQSNLFGQTNIEYYGFIFDCENLEVYMKHKQGSTGPFRNPMNLNRQVPRQST